MEGYSSRVIAVSASLALAGNEISGLGRGKITQTFSVDQDTRQMRIVVLLEGGREAQPRTITHVYDADQR